MRLKGGFLPKIAGRPSSLVEEIGIPGKLYIHLKRKGLVYKPLVQNSQVVEQGQILAQVLGSTLSLPSPVSGTVFVDEVEDGSPLLIIDTYKSKVKKREFQKKELNRITRDELVETLSESGIWPFFWSSKENGTPSLAGESPRSIIINFLAVEPFRTRGRVILDRNYENVIEGIKYLNKLLAEYGTIEIVLTSPKDPLARKIYKDLSGYAWVKFHQMSLRYPVENNLLLNRTFRKESSAYSKDDSVWIIDAQGVSAVGDCLISGSGLTSRVIALGGPGCKNPRHISVQIGTLLKDLVSDENNDTAVKVLRGGLFTGKTVDLKTDSVLFDDDAYFILADDVPREFMSFVRPGFKRTSYLPVFATNITGGVDIQLSTLLRGEQRPCVSCGLCENICPSRLMPQLLHRYLFNEDLDEAEKIGLNRCIDCNLCTYVCPSKIELQKQFSGAKLKLQVEHEEAAAILRRQNGS